MIKTKEELMKSAQTLLGESTDDNALSFLEDIADTLDDINTKTTDTTDWKTKYDELDASWRKKYKDRFFSGGTEPDSNLEDEVNEPTKPEEKSKEETITFDDLFTEKE